MVFCLLRSLYYSSIFIIDRVKMKPVCVDTEWLQKVLTENPDLVESFREYHGCSIEECVEIERKMYLELKRQFKGKNCAECDN